MSRITRFTHSVLSGYVLIGANVIYTFASVPLAVQYLSPAEFALWALTMTIGGYITLIDMGMSASVSRILIDYKDKQAGGDYGSIIKTGGLVGAVQGSLVFLAGSILALAAGALLHVPPELQNRFTWLLIGQSGVLGLMFAARIFGHLLVAHQRYDIANYGQALIFCMSLLGMWAGFAKGLGVFSLLIGQAVGTLLGILVNLGGCLRLKLFPAPGEWGNVTRGKFNELFAYGKDVFLYAIGVQFINASQAILLTRFLGLEVAAVWNVCTRTYTMLTMLIWRIQDYSGPALAEMLVRGERDRLLKRFKELAVSGASLSVVAGVLLAVCNGPFLPVWLHGRSNWPQLHALMNVYWPPVNDLLLGVWLVVGTTMRMSVFLAGATKQFGFLRYVFLVEGSVFVGLGILLHLAGGITGMLVLSIVCTGLFSLPYTMWRVHKYFALRWRDLAAWYRSSWRLAWRLAAVALVVWWVTRAWEPAWRLAANGGLCGLSGLFALLRYGLSPSLQTDIAAKLPLRMRRIFLGFTEATEQVRGGSQFELVTHLHPQTICRSSRSG